MCSQVIRAVLVVEIPLCVMQLGPECLVLWRVQIVGYSGLAQHYRVALLIHEVQGVKQFACLRIRHLQLTHHKHIVHFSHRGVVWTLRLTVKTQQQALDAVVHLARVLVLELLADKRLIALPLVSIHTLTEAVRTQWQSVAELGLVVTDGTGHLAPVNRLAVHGLAHDVRVCHHTHNGLQHRGVHRVLVYLVRWQGTAVLKTETGIKRPGFCIDAVMLAEPVLQNVLLHFSVLSLDAVLETLRKCGNLNQGIIAQTFAQTHHVNLTAC